MNKRSHTQFTGRHLTFEQNYYPIGKTQALIQALFQTLMETIMMSCGHYSKPYGIIKQRQCRYMSKVIWSAIWTVLNLKYVPCLSFLLRYKEIDKGCTKYNLPKFQRTHGSSFLFVTCTYWLLLICHAYSSCDAIQTADIDTEQEQLELFMHSLIHLSRFIHSWRLAIFKTTATVQGMYLHSWSTMYNSTKHCQY